MTTSSSSKSSSKPVTDFSELFGGKSEVKKKLVRALKSGREEARLTHEELDALCGFNSDRKFPGISIVTSRNYEASPDVLNGNVFSIVSQVLGVEVDEALTADLSPEKKRSLAKAVRSDFTWVGSGGDFSAQTNETEAERDAENQVPLFVLLNVLHEIDS